MARHGNGSGCERPTNVRAVSAKCRHRLGPQDVFEAFKVRLRLEQARVGDAVSDELDLVKPHLATTVDVKHSLHSLHGACLRKVLAAGARG